MPRGWKPKEEREMANFIRERDKQFALLQGQIALTKYKKPVHEIAKKKNEKSPLTITRAKAEKIRKNVENAKIIELFDYCFLNGKKVVITIE
jgi:hypothetical protein